MRKVSVTRFPGLRSILVAGLSVLCAAVARWLLELGVSGVVPFATFYPAILVSTLLAGPLAGGLTLAMSVVAVLLLVPSSFLSLGTLSAAVNLLLFVVTGAVVVVLAILFQSQRRALDAYEQRDGMTNRELIASQERLRRVLESVPVGILETDAHGRIVFANDAAERMLGLTAQDITRRDFKADAWGLATVAGDPIDPSDLPAARALRGETVRGFEHAVRHEGTGQRVVVSVNAAPLVDARGAITGSLAAVTDITAQRALVERLQLAQTAGGIGLWEWDIASNRVWWSDNVGPLLGYPSGTQPTYDNWTEIIHPLDRDRVVADVSAAVEQGVPLNSEFRVQTTAGAWRWFASRGEVIRDKNGRAVQVVGVNHDITARKEAEIASSERAEEFRTLFEAVPSPLFIARDAGSLLIEGNKAARAMLKADLSDNLSKTGAEQQSRLRHFKVLDASGAELEPKDLPVQRAARGEVISNFEEHLVFSDGTVLDMIVNAVPLRTSDGHPRGAIAAFADVTDIKRAERAAREREAQFRTLAETINDVFYMTAFNPRRLLYVSPAFETIWGRPDAWLIEAPERFLETIHPDDRANVAAAAERQERGEPVTLEYRIVRPDGTIRWIADRCFPVADKPDRCVGLAEDVTARKVEEERKALLVEELNHRVKNTLAVVQAIARQTLKSGSADTQRKALETRLQALARAHDILTAEHWVGADFADLVRQAAEATGVPSKMIITGPSVRLAPNAALAVSLALHELATNAAKYGSLSTTDGTVRVDWTAVPADEGVHLQFEWREYGGPPVTPNPAKGFGSQLIERSLARDLGAQVTLDFDPTGLRCRFDVVLR